MPKLISSVVGLIITPESCDAQFVKQFEGQVGSGDYFEVFGLTVIQQDFSKVNDAINLPKPPFFGINNRYNKVMVTLVIDK
jgi:hypothetical protein